MTLPTRRILVLANETADDPALVAAVGALAGGRRATRVLVVAPALGRSPRRLADEDRERAEARGRLLAALAALARAGVDADGLIGDADPPRAAAAALRLFPADRIVVSTHAPSESRWLARGVVERLRAFDVPVTHVVALGDTLARAA